MAVNADSLEFISSIYEVALNHIAWEDVLNKLACLANAKASSILLADRTFPENQINAVSSAMRGSLEEYATHYAADEAPVISQLANYPIHQFLPMAELFRSVGKDLSQEPVDKWFKEKYQLHERMAVRLNDRVEWLDCLSFYFGPDDVLMANHNREDTALFFPHISRSIELARPFQLLQVRFHAVLSVLDRLHVGTFILSGSGEVIVRNKEADRILELKDGLRLDHHNKLTTWSPEGKSRLGAALQSVCQTAKAQGVDSGRLLKVERKSGADPLLVDIAPLYGSELTLDPNLRGALVMVSDPLNRTHLSIKGIKVLYGLTKAEEAVCELLVNGMRTDDIADSRNVSPETVRSQIKSIFSKTSSNHRVDLIRIALSVNIPVDQQKPL